MAFFSSTHHSKFLFSKKDTGDPACLELRFSPNKLYEHQWLLETFVTLESSKGRIVLFNDVTDEQPNPNCFDQKYKVSAIMNISHDT
jgi:hypothetical protein